MKLIFSLIKSIIIMTIVFTVSLNCGDKKDKDKTSDAANGKNNTEESTDDTTSDDNSSEEAKPLSANEELMSILKAMCTNCEGGDDDCICYSCKNKEEEKMEEWIEKNGLTNALETFLVAISDEENKRLTSVAAAEMYGLALSGRMFEPEDQIPKHLPNHVVDIVNSFGSEDCRANSGASFLAQILLQAGKKDKLFTLIDNHPNNHFKNQSVARLLLYGRLENFDKVKEYAAAGDEDAKRFALEALANFTFYKSHKPEDMSEEEGETLLANEKEQYCPWAESFLSDESEAVATKAATQLVWRCEGKYIDSVLNTIEEHINNESYSNEWNFPARDVCRQSTWENYMMDKQKTLGQEAADAIGNLLSTDNHGTDEQCNRVVDLLQKVVDSNKYEVSTRTHALSSIASQKETEEGLAIIKKYANHSNEKIKEKANAEIQSLQEEIDHMKKRIEEDKKDRQ